MALPNYNKGKRNLPTHLEGDENQIFVNSRNAYCKVFISISGPFLIGESYITVRKVLFILKVL